MVKQQYTWLRVPPTLQNVLPSLSGAPMEALSEVLKSVKLDGAMFFNAEFSSPWCTRSVNGCDVTSYLSPKSQHVIIFHLLTEGSGYARLEGTEERRVALNAGDILVVPHGDGHILGNGPPVMPVDRSHVIKQALSQGLKVARMGGGGEVTRFSRVFLAGLPPILKVRIHDDASGCTFGQWLEQSIRRTVNTLDASKLGAKVVLAKLSEALFVETLRCYIAQLPQEQTGWLADVRDPAVGQALALLHRRPADPWTLASLSTEVGISRSVLAER